jgi:hypothetical protein
MGHFRSPRHNDTSGLSDSTFRWDAGTEASRSQGLARQAACGRSLIDRTAIKASIVETVAPG